MTMAEILIKNIETQEVIKRIDVTGKSENYKELCLRGVLRNLNTDKYIVYEEALNDS